MVDWKIYSNPACSKCRQAVQLVREMGIEPEIVEYLKNTPSVEEIESFIEMSGLSPEVFLRNNDDSKNGDLNLDVTNRNSVAEAIHQNPAILQRPVVVHQGRSVVARPAELLKSLIKKS